MSQDTVVVTVGCDESVRAAAIARVARNNLEEWFERLTAGVSYSDELATALARVFIDQAATLIVATSASARSEDINATSARCERAAEAALEVLLREICS